MTRILIPIDFSDCSLNALSYGIKYAKKMETEPELIIAHGYHIPVPAAEFSININASVLEEFKNDAVEKYEKLKEKMPELDKLGAKFDIKLAFVLDAIIKCIQEESPDLIIMGTKGSSGLNEVIFGSNTSGVIKSAKVPVLAIPQNFEEDSISRITFAYDKKELDDITILQIIKDLARHYNAPVDILHVHDGSAEGSKGLDDLAEFFEDINHEFHVVDKKKVADGIEDFLEETHSDLLAMIPRKHGLIERLFSGSVTAKMAHHTTIPLLAIPVG